MRCASRAISKSVRALATLLLAAGCSELRPLEGVPRCEPYATTVQPIFTARCTKCHGPAKAEGEYRLDSRRESLALRGDGSSRVLGADALVLQAARGELAGHSAVPAAEVTTLTTWAVDCRAGEGQPQFHVRGWGTPGDEAFHGRSLRASGYELTECKKCHGDDLSGGKSRVSCQTCHGKQVLTCATCHGSDETGAPPRSLSGATATSAPGVGAHQVHLTDGPLHAAYKCEVCHTPVTDVAQEGHYLVNGAMDDGIAEVKLAQGSWDRSAGTCSVSCHAPGMNDTAATNKTPHWTKVGTGEAACGTCHGAPPSSHAPGAACGTCHPNALADGGVMAATHADGVVQLGRPGTVGAVTCGSCHGDGTGTFSDLLGRTDPSLETVGLHQVHLAGARRLTSSLSCNACHQVPSMVRDPGHIDTAAPAEVFPQGAAMLARADGAMPTFTASFSCTNVYCHGGGTRAALDTSPSKVTTVPWTSGYALTCGTCHGAPPNTTVHATATTLASCNQCHPQTISAAGNLVVTDLADGGVSTTHLNGTVEHN